MTTITSVRNAKCCCNVIASSNNNRLYFKRVTHLANYRLIFHEALFILRPDCTFWPVNFDAVLFEPQVVETLSNVRLSLRTH